MLPHSPKDSFYRRAAGAAGFTPAWCRREESNPDRPDTNGLLDR